MNGDQTMRKISIAINALAFLILSLAVTSIAEALPLRTFVSSSGNNDVRYSPLAL
jgi:hypothetical protein